VKVTIDPAKCMGHGMCYALAPSVYTDDDEGYGQVVGDCSVPAEHMEAARTGAANCPENAISFQE
jgi:ferredoxin